jgi:hypothetical protein
VTIIDNIHDKTVVAITIDNNVVNECCVDENDDDDGNNK